MPDPLKISEVTEEADALAAQDYLVGNKVVTVESVPTPVTSRFPLGLFFDYVASAVAALSSTVSTALNLKLDANHVSVTNARTPTGGAGGVLGGTYPNPSFAVDMATQAELDAVAAAKANVAHSHIDATTSAAGFMTAADKTKLNGIAAGANNYTLPTPMTTVMGGVKRNTGSAGQFVNGISSSGDLVYGTPVGGGEGPPGIPGVLHVNRDATGTADGSLLRPYAGLQDAFNAAFSSGTDITIKLMGDGDFSCVCPGGWPARIHLRGDGAHIATASIEMRGTSEITSDHSVSITAVILGENGIEPGAAGGDAPTLRLNHVAGTVSSVGGSGQVGMDNTNDPQGAGGRGGDGGDGGTIIARDCILSNLTSTGGGGGGGGDGSPLGNGGDLGSFGPVTLIHSRVGSLLCGDLSWGGSSVESIITANIINDYGATSNAPFAP